MNCGAVYKCDDNLENRWLCGHTLASDANGPGSTPVALSSLTQATILSRIGEMCGRPN